MLLFHCWLYQEDKVKEDEKEMTSNTTEIVNKTVETDPVEITDNAVLRKLLVSWSNVIYNVVLTKMQELR